MNSNEFFDYLKLECGNYNSRIIDLNENMSSEDFEQVSKELIHDILTDESLIKEYKIRNNVSKPVNDLITNLRKSYKNTLGLYRDFKLLLGI